MGDIEKEDILGYNLSGGKVLCCECCDGEYGDDHEISEVEVITEADRDNHPGSLFCDSCRNEI